MHSRHWVLIVDFGSQYTQLIGRRIRELGVYCEISPPQSAMQHMQQKKPHAVILSGGPSSVYAINAPTLDPSLFQQNIPILGICYGMQWIAHTLGGKVSRANQHEYGSARVRIEQCTGIFSRMIQGDALEVWMSHGDRIDAPPTGFVPIGITDHSPFAAIGHIDKKIYGVQFHPEVAHTPRGRALFSSFLFDVAHLKADWTPNAFVDESIEQMRTKVGPSDRAICALSGGVDSSVAALLCHRAIGSRLLCIFVDNGLLREGEANEVVSTFREHFHMPLVAVDASSRFLTALKGVTDPEQKRKVIGRLFIDVFEEEAKKIEDARFLVQGTLYPDVIESESFKGPSAVIKTHHNVGGLPEKMHLKLLEPLRELFKDEVRAAGEALGMPRSRIARHPFPGPGLAIRCLGEVTAARLAVLRKADAIAIDEIQKAGLYDEIWQLFCVLLPVRTVGVMGDERTYDEVCALRAVRSVDGMTADWAPIPHEILGRISTRITNEVRGINRVVYDISSKPPATIEWE